jgi:hypothetical protein
VRVFILWEVSMKVLQKCRICLIGDKHIFQINNVGASQKLLSFRRVISSNFRTLDPTNIRCRGTKYSRQGELAAGFCTLLRLPRNL